MSKRELEMDFKKPYQAHEVTKLGEKKKKLQEI